MAVYSIKNNGGRARGFRVRGGVESVAPGKTRVLELKEELSDAALKQLKAASVDVSESSEEPENAVTEGKSVPLVRPAQNPAETGGVVPQSEISEKGGVDRKPGDTTTTTKPTEKQTGPKA